MFSRFIWFISKFFWLVMVGLCVMSGLGIRGSWLVAIVIFIMYGLEKKHDIVQLFIVGVICVALNIVCGLLEEKVHALCDDMAYRIHGRRPQKHEGWTDDFCMGSGGCL